MDEDFSFISLAALMANVVVWLTKEKEKPGENGWHSQSHHANDAEKQPSDDREEFDHQTAKQ